MGAETPPVENGWFRRPGPMGTLQNALLTCGFWSPVTEHRCGTILLRLSVWVPYLSNGMGGKDKDWSCDLARKESWSFTLHTTPAEAAV